MLEHFYHSTIRKVVVGFASMFNNIHMRRVNSQGQEIERIRVPISYGPQQKFIRRLERIGTDFDQQKVRLETYLPRMSFEISGLQYDSSRKLNSIQKTVAFSQDRSKLKGRFERVPYNMTMNLGVMTKNTEDCLQIVEQILPYFTPEYVFTIKAIDVIDEDVDIQVVISSVSLSDGDDGSYGDYSTRKISTASLSFSAKMYLYGPVKDYPVIMETDANIFDSDDFGKDTSTIKKYTNINVVPAEGITAGGYSPSLTAGFTGSTHAEVTITEYPPEPWTVS
jgi:hypothetical protein